MDLSGRESILALIAKAQEHGPITMLVNAAGVSPSQAPIEAILKVDLCGTAVLPEEVGKVIAPGGVGVAISRQSGHRMKQLSPEEDEALACTPSEGSGMGSSEADLRKICKGAAVKRGLSIRGCKAEQSEAQAAPWARQSI